MLNLLFLLYLQLIITQSCCFVYLDTLGRSLAKEAGVTTGEEVEQINNNFSRLGNSTKHMLPEGA